MREFENILKYKFEEFEKQPPRSDWDIISRQMNDKRPTPIIRYIYATSAVAAMFIAALFLFNNEESTPTTIADLVNNAKTEISITELQDSTTPIIKAVETLRKKIEEDAKLAPVAVIQPEITAQPAPIEKREAATFTKPQQRFATTTSPTKGTDRVFPKKRRNNWSLALFANGTSVGSGNSNNSANGAPRMGIYEVNITNPVQTAIETANFKHNMPINAGLSVRKMLSKRWGIETGITYSYLSSKAELNSSFKYKITQRAHYLGIPVAVTYTPLRTKNIELYAKAGGEANFNLQTTRNTSITSMVGQPTSESDKFRVKDVQFSTNIDAGVMYNITPSLGIYFEPGVGYFFDNGSNVETYWSEKPLNFNLKVGFRTTF